MAAAATRRSKFITEMPAFPDLYKQVHGKMPSGAMWDALNWLTNQTGELTFVGLAPPATNAGARRDPAQGLSTRRRTIPSSSRNSPSATACPTRYIDVERGRGVFRSLADVQPGVLTTLRAAIGGTELSDSKTGIA